MSTEQNDSRRPRTNADTSWTRNHRPLAYARCRLISREIHRVRSRVARAIAASVSHTPASDTFALVRTSRCSLQLTWQAPGDILSSSNDERRPWLHPLGNVNPSPALALRGKWTKKPLH